MLKLTNRKLPKRQWWENPTVPLLWLSCCSVWWKQATTNKSLRRRHRSGSWKQKCWLHPPLMRTDKPDAFATVHVEFRNDETYFNQFRISLPAAEQTTPQPDGTTTAVYTGRTVWQLIYRIGMELDITEVDVSFLNELRYHWGAVTRNCSRVPAGTTYSGLRRVSWGWRRWMW
jgi:hypothetical protein